MFSKILFTFVSRFLSSVLAFLIVVITAKLIGAEGRGVISLIVLGTAITLLVNNIVGGNAIVLLTPKVEPVKLLIPSYLWAFISCALVTFILHLSELTPPEYSIHIFFISLLQSIGSIHLSVFLGRQKIRLYNMMTVLQVVVLFAVIAYLYLFQGEKDVMSYIVALYISFAIQALITSWFISKEISSTPLSGMKQVLRMILANGLIIQLCNVIQILNYRLSYFFLEEHHGLVALGVFSTASIVAESVWLISRSIALVQYAGIVNSDDPDYNKRVTVRLAKLSAITSMLAWVPLLMLPPAFYSFLFGEEFRNIGGQLWWYAPGIMALAFSTVFGHYFAGLGMNRINLYGTLTGFAVTLAASWLLIPEYGINGAAMSVSLAYCIHAVYLFFIYKKHTKLIISELIPTREDLNFVWKELKLIIRKQD